MAEEGRPEERDAPRAEDDRREDGGHGGAGAGDFDEVSDPFSTCAALSDIYIVLDGDWAV